MNTVLVTGDDRVLHQPKQVSAIGRNGEALHAAVGLPAGHVQRRIELERVARGIDIAARIGVQ
jgi:hypothetical protein